MDAPEPDRDGDPEADKSRRCNVTSIEPRRPRPSTAAARMRRHRERRRDGMRCFIVELRETEIDALVRKGLLKDESRNDRIAILQSLYDFLDRTLGRPP